MQESGNWLAVSDTMMWTPILLILTNKNPPPVEELFLLHEH